MTNLRKQCEEEAKEIIRQVVSSDCNGDSAWINGSELKLLENLIVTELFAYAKKAEEAEVESKNCIEEIQTIVDDFPYQEQTITEAVNAIGWAYKGAVMACDELHRVISSLTHRLEAAEHYNEALKKRLAELGGEKKRKGKLLGEALKKLEAAEKGRDERNCRRNRLGCQSCV